MTRIVELATDVSFMEVMNAKKCAASTAPTAINKRVCRDPIDLISALELRTANGSRTREAIAIL